jgi:hypothetical protein
LEFGQKGFHKLHKLCQSNSTNICNFK